MGYLRLQPSPYAYSIPVVLSVKSSNSDVLRTDPQVVIPANDGAFLELKTVPVTKKTPVRLTLKRGAYTFVTVVTLTP